jgi:hypothetical protein
MAMSTLGSFLRIRNQALVSIPGLMEVSIRDNGTPTKGMVMASNSLMTVISMKVNGKKINGMGSGF